MDLKSNSNSAKLLGRDGKPISSGDSPNLGLGMDPKQPEFTPMELSEGDWPVGAGQIVIDAATAGFRELQRRRQDSRRRGRVD